MAVGEVSLGKEETLSKASTGGSYRNRGLACDKEYGSKVYL
jgi:hypothetical protein